jgi:uncharacterized protein DUF669
MTSIGWSELRRAAGEAGFTPLPAGDYDLVVEEATGKQSSSGKDMIALKFSVESGPFQGRSVFTNIVISPDSAVALGFLFRKMSAFGLDEEYFEKNPTLEQVAEDLENRRCAAEVTQREWNGSIRNDINTIKPPSDGISIRPSGPIPDSGLGVFGSNGAGIPAHASHGRAPELPF